jgi:methylenetetrahydrofolate dehydrogenase (NADP+)/methenyltetrahydrofolate cyclohydrolase
VANKKRACEEVGFTGFHRELPAAASAGQISEVIVELNAHAEVDGILLQLPLPEGIDAGPLTASIAAEKDVDGLTPASVAALALGRPGLRPCTPSGVIELLDREGIPIEGARAVIVGRSDLVGRPLVDLLLAQNATVTICHSRTSDLAGVCSSADILIAAAGRPRLITAEYVKEGAAVIDVGINRVDGGLVGDVDTEAVSDVAGWITPVPGGVGPMTIAMLLRNTLQARVLREAS